MTIFATRLGRAVSLAIAGMLAAAALTTTLGVATASPADRGERSRAHLERNKQTVVAFYTLAFNQKQPAEAVNRYVGPVYIQHTF